MSTEKSGLLWLDGHTGRLGVREDGAVLNVGGVALTVPAAAGTLDTVAARTTAGLPASGGFTASPRTVHTGNMSVTQTSDGNDTTPSITETYIAEVFVPCNMTITGVANFNGSAVGSDKLMAILYSSAGAVLATSLAAGTTAVGTDTYQRLALTTPYAAVGPATYYVGIQCDGTTARLNTHIAGNFGASKKTAETFGTATAITAPTTFTTAVGPIASLY